VREHLAEHLLGTLDEPTDVAVRAHARGCASCRTETSALAEGVATLAAAAHDVEPPRELRERVLGVLDEEWADAARAHEQPTPRRRRIARAAAIAALAAAVSWAAIATVQASRLEDEAGKYEALLSVLGGQDVRVGVMRPASSSGLEGSVVVYDSNVGQSWVLVLCRAPGWDGTANVTLLDDRDRRIELRPIEFGPQGEGSTWLVTASDLTGFERVNVWDETGVLASADVRPA
jgi:hypothetical protein